MTGDQRIGPNTAMISQGLSCFGGVRTLTHSPAVAMCAGSGNRVRVDHFPAMRPSCSSIDRVFSVTASPYAPSTSARRVEYGTPLLRLGYGALPWAR